MNTKKISQADAPVYDRCYDCGCGMTPATLQHPSLGIVLAAGEANEDGELYVACPNGHRAGFRKVPK
jgi:hypothetical protein